MMNIWVAFPAVGQSNRSQTVINLPDKIWPKVRNVDTDLQRTDNVNMRQWKIGSWLHKIYQTQYTANDHEKETTTQMMNYPAFGRTWVLLSQIIIYAAQHKFTSSANSK